MEPSIVTDWRINYCELNACMWLFVRLPGVLPSPGLRLRLHFIYKRSCIATHYPQQRCLWVFYFSNKSKNVKKIAPDANQGLFKSYVSIFLGRTTRALHALSPFMLGATLFDYSQGRNGGRNNQWNHNVAQCRRPASPRFRSSSYNWPTRPRCDPNGAQS